MANKHDTMTMLEYEDKFLSEGASYIAGVDEVGRGPLAGPVMVACVIMPLDKQSIILGVNDSKKLSAKKRDELFLLINERAIEIKIASLDEKKIDEINILNATKTCMSDAINALEHAPDVVLIDAVNIPSVYKIEPIIKGDLKSYSIACASIVAKVTRDRLMCQYALTYPQYGFEGNKGYGSAEHIEALKKFGACPIHRKSFIKNFCK